MPDRADLLRPLRERIVIFQGVVMIILTVGVVGLALALAGAKSSAACSTAQEASVSSTQATRQALGNEGRAAAAALATSVLAAAASPADIRTSLVAEAEKVYATTMITVNAGLAEHPVPLLKSC